MGFTTTHFFGQLARYHAVNSFAQQKLAKQDSESIFWNFSGSTLIHIFVILGLGFYVSQVEPPPQQRTITVNLKSVSELSAETKIGKGAQMQKEAGQSSEQRTEDIIRIEDGNTPFDNGTFVLAQERLIKDIQENKSAMEESERIGFLGVYDDQPAYRQYQQYWQTYVSEFGTQHYPGELIEKGLNGSLELDIAIDRHGVVRSTTIHRSSGNATIDNAAIKIAVAAGPYKSLPEGMAKDIDVLHIIRIWEFNNSTLSSRARQ
jgi:protein TonB